MFNLQQQQGRFQAGVWSWLELTRIITGSDTLTNKLGSDPDPTLVNQPRSGSDLIRFTPNFFYLINKYVRDLLVFQVHYKYVNSVYV